MAQEDYQVHSRRSRTPHVLDKRGSEIRYEGMKVCWKSHPKIWGPTMSIRGCVLLVLALVVSACASSQNTPFGGEGGTATRASQGNSRLIVRAQLERLAGQSAWRAVETLRQRWLRPVRGGSMAGPSYARVVIDGSIRGELDELRLMSTESIESLRYLSATDATTKYGTGYFGGVIEVTMRRR